MSFSCDSCFYWGSSKRWSLSLAHLDMAEVIVSAWMCLKVPIPAADHWVFVLYRSYLPQEMQVASASRNSLGKEILRRGWLAMLEYSSSGRWKSPSNSSSLTRKHTRNLAGTPDLQLWRWEEKRRSNKIKEEELASEAMWKWGCRICCWRNEAQHDSKKWAAEWIKWSLN